MFEIWLSFSREMIKGLKYVQLHNKLNLMPDEELAYTEQSHRMIVPYEIASRYPSLFENAFTINVQLTNDRILALPNNAFLIYENEICPKQKRLRFNPEFWIALDKPVEDAQVYTTINLPYLFTNLTKIAKDHYIV